MKATHKKILFISHDASRTGAPIVLLQFLRWLKANTDIPFEILIASGGGNHGELVPDFRSLSAVTVLSDLASYSASLSCRAMRKMGFDRGTKQGYLSILRRQQADGTLGLIYSNTVANGPVLEWLSQLQVPVITHVHELEYTIRHYIGLEPFKRALRHTDRFIAASDAVRKTLVQNHGVPDQKVDMVHEFIEIPTDYEKNQSVRERLLTRIMIPQDALIVGGAGTLHWRKGSDIFIQLVRLLHGEHASAPVYFLWVGGSTENLYFHQLHYDLQRLGLEKYVRFVGTVPNPFEYFSVIDVFAMTSREDPFPLVCLEAASLGKPIVCFERAGGIREFVEEDCGYILPYLDVTAMADKVMTLLENAELRRQFGARALQKVAERHDINVSAPKILEIMQRSL